MMREAKEPNEDKRRREGFSWAGQNHRFGRVIVEAKTPMLAQYASVKREHPDALLFFRLGDFYEMFYDDAEVAARELELVLTGRDAGGGKRAPMCGVPYHAATQYISRLIGKGYKVAICEQMEDPRSAKGLVKREVVRIITPGTVVDGEFLEDKRNNFIGAVCWLRAGGGRRACVGLAFADVSTGEFSATQIDSPDPKDAMAEMLRVQPSELVAPPALQDHPVINGFRARDGKAVVTFYRESAFSIRESSAMLRDHFGVASLDALGFQGMPAAICAAGALLSYVTGTQMSGATQISSLRPYRTGEFVSVDPWTRRNLEILKRNSDGSETATLLWVLDRTVTCMGARMLRAWMQTPLRNVDAISARLDAVGFFVENLRFRARLRATLSSVYDLERLAGRISCGTANARDLVALRQSLEALDAVRSCIMDIIGEGNGGGPSFSRLAGSIEPLEDVVRLIADSIEDDPPLQIREGGLIRAHYDDRVDALREASSGGKEWISRLERDERASTGIKSLKVGYNRVFGYYIEVTRANLHLVPERYIRKQTLTDAERFITPELKEKEAQVLGADQSLGEIEYELFREIRDKVASRCPAVQERARAIAEIDCLASLAEAAAEGRYSRPVVEAGDRLYIKEGRHPVLERVMGPGRFIPNDIHLDDTVRMMLITGPNMSGKSTILATSALIVFMAHIGSFVPAASATIGLVDGIFYRTGSYEDLSAGRSTFMVELTEVAAILNSATRDSLVLVDELGRGTSTYDGMALAQATLEYLHERVGCRVLFTTHYHELAAVERRLPGVKNYHVTAVERGGSLTFLYRLTPGAVDKSYGVNVARMAGLPREVLKRAGEILESLERQSPSRPRQYSLFEAVCDPGPMVDAARIEAAAAGVTGYPAVEAEVIAILKGLDLENMTPLDALKRLAEIQRLLDGRD